MEIKILPLGFKISNSWDPMVFLAVVWDPPVSQYQFHQLTHCKGCAHTPGSQVTYSAHHLSCLLNIQRQPMLSHDFFILLVGKAWVALPKVLCQKSPRRATINWKQGEEPCKSLQCPWYKIYHKLSVLAKHTSDVSTCQDSKKEINTNKIHRMLQYINS